MTLGVDDVPASARFYEALGFKRKFRATGDEIAFFDGGGVVFAVWDWKNLADDATEAGALMNYFFANFSALTPSLSATPATATLTPLPGSATPTR